MYGHNWSCIVFYTQAIFDPQKILPRYRPSNQINSFITTFMGTHGFVSMTFHILGSNNAMGTLGSIISVSM